MLYLLVGRVIYWMYRTGNDGLYCCSVCKQYLQYRARGPRKAVGSHLVEIFLRHPFWRLCSCYNGATITRRSRKRTCLCGTPTRTKPYNSQPFEMLSWWPPRPSAHYIVVVVVKAFLVELLSWWRFRILVRLEWFHTFGIV